MINKTKLTMVALGVSLFATGLSAASFNCRNASTKIEKAICGDRYLSQLDGKMGRVYQRALHHANIKYDQRDWLSHRNRSCGANEDCLYDMTKSRIRTLRKVIRRGGNHNGGSANHRKSIFFPARGIVCDRKPGFCADSYGLSLGYTKIYLGQRQQDKWDSRINDNFNTTVFALSNRVYCDTNVRTCYTNRRKDRVDHYFTNKLFR